MERGRGAFELQGEDCALPGGQEEFGEIRRIERCIDFASGLSLGDARGKRSAPFLEYFLQPLAQQFALRGGLKTEITDQATAMPFGVCQYAADDVQILLQPLSGGKGLVVQSLFDEYLEVSKIAV